MYRRRALGSIDVGKQMRGLEEVEQVAMVSAAGRTFEQGVDRRRSAGRGQFPARLVRDQDLLPFEQGADAARSQPILGDQRDPPQPLAEPGEYLRSRRFGLGLATAYGKQ